MRRVALVGFLAALAAGCNQSLPPQQTAVAVRSEGPPPAPADDLIVRQPIHFRNLTIFPVSSRQPRMQDRFITLEEGRAAGTVQVLEMGAEQLAADGAPVNDAPQAPNSAPNPPEQEIAANPPPQGDQDDPFANAPALDDLFFNGQQAAQPAQQIGAGNQVDRLVVINTSEKPLYLMPGETIVGGSQDRTIGRELVIQPDGKPVPIDVFCVESGRWGMRGEYQTQEFVGNLSLVIGNISAVQEEDLERAAAAANRGEFIASAGVLTKDARLAVQSAKNQSKVWEEVARQNAAAGVEIDTGAFTANYTAPDAAARFQPYRENLLAPVEETENVVGVVVAINGEVDSLDIFESTPLFARLWPKLLMSYALDAATRSEESVAHKQCSRRQARAFLAEATSAEIAESETKDGIALVRRAGDRVTSFIAGEASSADFSGGFGGVHASAFAH